MGGWGRFKKAWPQHKNRKPEVEEVISLQPLKQDVDQSVDTGTFTTLRTPHQIHVVTNKMN